MQHHPVGIWIWQETRYVAAGPFHSIRSGGCNSIFSFFHFFFPFRFRFRRPFVSSCIFLVGIMLLPRFLLRLAERISIYIIRIWYVRESMGPIKKLMVPINRILNFHSSPSLDSALCIQARKREKDWQHYETGYPPIYPLSQSAE